MAGTASDLPSATSWGHGALWALAGTLLSLPPKVVWGGHAIVVPQTLLDQWTPLYDVIRVPSRLGVAGLIGLCLLAGLGYAEIAGAVARWSRNRRGRAVQAVLGVVALALVYWIPPGGKPRLPARFPLQPAPRVPAAFLRVLRAGHEPLVQLPALRADGRPLPLNAVAMFRSVFHWRPILNGYSSYWPAGFVERMRLAEELPDPHALTALLRETGVGLVWVDLRGSPAGTRERWARAGKDGRDGLALRARAEGQMLFAVRADDSNATR